MLLHFSAYRRTRRALARDQGRTVPCSLPLWRLLAGEVAVLARRVGLWRVGAVVGSLFAVVLLAEVVMSADAPGPALTNPLRWAAAAVAAAVGLGCWAVVYALRRVPAQE